ncbi:MAG: MarR family transcriptional regulator [Clostridia bacterium]|nr:MarR family transcriptional regulator [Clostridia bacterium]
MYDNGLLEKFARIHWLLHKYYQHNHMVYGPMSDPHRGQGRVLKLLKMKPEISQKELSFLLDIRPQSLGELLDKLERSGYIVRTPSKDDKRSLNVKLTEEGEKVKFEPPERINIFDCLCEEEQNTLQEYLNRIIKNFEEHFGEERYERKRHCHKHHGYFAGDFSDDGRADSSEN